MNYDVIYADPPWRYDYARTNSRKVENHYPTMTVPQICAVDVAAMAADPCVLFLWATAPKLEEALTVMRAWGFSYRTNAVWDKGRFGMGYYFRGQHEHLLIGTRGKPRTPDPANRIASVLREPRGRHSQKPIAAYEAIERMYPNARRLELFARIRRDGWDAWGDEIESDVA